MEIHAFAAKDAKNELSEFNYPAAPIGPFDVRVEISHCGICHSDVHLVDNDWGVSSYPLVPGHEIVGQVVEVGPSVTRLSLGDRVGIGWQRSSCLECHECASGNENLCSQQTAICQGNHGGFADQIVTDSRFVFLLPDTMDSETAAPLLCAGVTVFSPLKYYNVRPTDRVGVIGVGGLGHLALQFVRAWGCEVTAFSSSADKEPEARQMGAHSFVNSRNADSLEAVKRKFDFILSTVNVGLDWQAYVNCLKPGGKLCFVGAAGQLDGVVIPTLLQQKQIVGSVIGGRATMMDMLSFAARHRIAAKTERVSFAEANAALDRVRKGKARYRIVLERE